MPTATTPENSAISLGFITFFRIMNSGKDKAVTAIMNASVVPKAAPLPSSACTTGMMPAALEYIGTPISTASDTGQGPQTRDFNDGFLNRLVQQLGGRARPMAFTAQLPLSLRGAERVPNMAMGQVGRSGIAPRQQALLERMWGGTAQGASVREGFAVHATVMRDMQAQGWEAEMAAASRGAINPRGFVAEAARVGGLMRASFDLGFIDVGGWDTHVNEAGENGAQGQLADKLGALSQGLAALAQAMGPAWRDTTVVVLSEFGRTFRENGNRGTDHGHGTVYWVLGGGVRGGRIAGEQVALSPATLNQNRDNPVLTEDRDLLGGLFQRLWGLESRRVQAVFPGSRPVDLKLL